MNTFTWKSFWRIRHTDEMRSILEVVLNSFDNLKKGKVQIMLSLNETKAGEACTIKWMTGMPETMDYIRSCKVSEGKDVRVISRIFGGVIVSVENRAARGEIPVGDAVFHSREQRAK